MAAGRSMSDRGAPGRRAVAPPVQLQLAAEGRNRTSRAAALAFRPRQVSQSLHVTIDSPPLRPSYRQCDGHPPPEPGGQLLAAQCASWPPRPESMATLGPIDRGCIFGGRRSAPRHRRCSFCTRHRGQAAAAVPVGRASGQSIAAGNIDGRLRQPRACDRAPRRHRHSAPGPAAAARPSAVDLVLLCGIGLPTDVAPAYGSRGSTSSAMPRP